MAYYAKMRDQQEQFLDNRAAPSAVLQTDLNLDQTQVQMLCDRWNDQSKGLHAGGVPILTHSLKVQPWTTPAAAKDLQLAELLKLTDEHIALAFRVPLQVLGLGSAPLGSTEALMQFWLASGLGFALNHIEKHSANSLDFPACRTKFVEFNTDALLRSAQKDRIDALVRGVQGGVSSPNEARNQEGLNSVACGDEPRAQQQVVPLSAAANIPVPPAPAAPAAAPVTLGYRDAVRRDMTMRVKRPASRKPVALKVKANGYVHPQKQV